MDVGSALAQFERAGAEADLRPALALLGGRELELDDVEVQPVVRRALLLLAASGDPHAGLELDGRAVTALANELFRPDRVTEVERGLRALRANADALPAVASALDELLDDPALAWRAYAYALLAEQLDE